MAGCRVATGAGAGDVEGTTTTGLGTLGTADLLELRPPAVNCQTQQKSEKRGKSLNQGSQDESLFLNLFVLFDKDLNCIQVNANKSSQRF